MAFYDCGIGKVGVSAKVCTLHQHDGNTFIINLSDIFVVMHDLPGGRLAVNARGLSQPILLASKNATTILSALNARLLALHGPFDADPANGGKFGGNSAIHLVT